MDIYATQRVRTELGAGSMDTFIYFAVAKLGWGTFELQEDLRKQLLARLHNARLAATLVDEVMDRLRRKLDPKKLRDKVKGTIDSVKNFQLSPWEIGKLTNGMLVGLWHMAQTERRIGNDLNPYRYGDEKDAYLDWLTYTYVMNGRVQPHFTGKDGSDT